MKIKPPKKYIGKNKVENLTRYFGRLREIQKNTLCCDVYEYFGYSKYGEQTFCNIYIDNNNVTLSFKLKKLTIGDCLAIWVWQQSDVDRLHIDFW